MKNIDLNADMGESYGRYRLGQDEQLMPLLTSCNIACGFHAGDPLTIKKTIALALEHKVKVGAHPSYPDLMGFGRRRMHLSAEELTAAIAYQISAIKGLVESQGGHLHHVKPHGALNNHMMEDPSVLHVVLEAVRSFDPALITYVPFARDLPQDQPIWIEVFADRTYEDDLQLTPRSVPGSLLDDLDGASAHLEQLIVGGQLRSRGGKSFKVDYQTVCIHGDNPAAVPIAKWIHQQAAQSEISLVSQ
ncbi:MAG: 5-oxoprolinase subunit PxpA [Bacteroidota bacterium]